MDGKQCFYVLSVIWWLCVLFEVVPLSVACSGVPLEEEEVEEEDTSWTGKFCALVQRIKGPPKPEKEQPTEEEERCPSKFSCLSIMVRPTQDSSKV